MRQSTGTSAGAWIILKKELKETLRDRRTLALMLMPLVLYPIIMVITAATVAEYEKKSRERTVRVRLFGKVPKPVRDHLESQESFQFLSHTSTTAADVSLRVGPLDEKETVTATLSYDQTSTYGRASVAKLSRSLKDFSQALAEEALRRRGIPRGVAQPLRIATRKTAQKEDDFAYLLSMIVPLLVTLFVGMAVFYPAIDSMSGEKERKTLTTLLTTSVSERQIVLGKFAAVLTIGLAAGTLNMLGSTLPLLKLLPAGRVDAAWIDLLSGAKALLLPVAVLVIAAPITALTLAVTALARSAKDAGLLVSPVMLIIMVPAMAPLVPEATLSPTTALFPIMGGAFLFQALLFGETNALEFFSVLASSAAFTLALVEITVRILKDEDARYSQDGRRADFRRVFLTPPKLGIGFALGFFCVCFAISYYASPTDSQSLKGDLVRLVVLGQGLGMLLPTLIVSAWLLRKKENAISLRMGAPPKKETLLWSAAFGVLAPFAVSLPAGWASALLLPGSEDVAREFEALLNLGNQPIWLLLICLSFLPAVTEELLFRGVLLGALGARLSERSAIISQAVLFAVVHGSVHRLLHSFALGLVLGIVAKRSKSVWPGVCLHMVHNAILLLLSRKTFGALNLDEPTSFLLPVALLFYVLLLKFERTYRTESKAPGI